MSGGAFTLPFRAARFAVRRARKLARDQGLGAGLSKRTARRLIEASFAFDEAWYRRTYGDVGLDALEHYIEHGFALGHNPSPLFWTAWYAARHPRSMRYGGGPLVHYLLGEGIDPNPVFDDVWYLAQAGEIGSEAPLTHYKRAGAAAGLDPHPLFQSRHYTEHCPALPEGVNPLTHFLDEGGRSGFDPSPYFASAIYLARYPDVAADGINPLAHFLLGGVQDLRDPSPHFCTARYLRWVEEARDSTVNPLIHAVEAGATDELYDPPAREPGPLPSLTLSVIVPNYNHAPFLHERLRSILDQSVAPDEIIFLDDASSDDSVQIAHSFAAESRIPFRILTNETNSRSPFAQWKKGIAAATGDLIWIAESDDRASPDFVSAVKPAFMNADVMLAYAQSRPITADGQPLAMDYRDYTDDLSLTRWMQPYNEAGRDEVIAALAHRNTIPNASAVMLRRSVALGVLDQLPRYRQCGDWLLYLACASAGRIAFTPDVLNDHRRHAGALTLALDASLAALDETIKVRLEAMSLFDLPNPTFLASVAAIAAEYHSRTVFMKDVPPLTAQDRFEWPLSVLQAETDRRFPRKGGRTLRIFGTIAEACAAPVGEAWLASARPDASPDATAPGAWIEGGPRATIWSAPAMWAGHDAAGDTRRVAILSHLAMLHNVKRIEARPGEAARLAAAIGQRTGIGVRTMAA